MPTITTPRHVKTSEDLVAIPRKEYEEFLRTQKRNGREGRVKHTMRAPKKPERFYNGLDRELTEALRDIEAGKTYGPFNTAEEAIRFLRRKR